jgi:hypothetical protein
MLMAAEACVSLAAACGEQSRVVVLVDSMDDDVMMVI